MLTHDSGNCLIQNGGMDNHDEDNDNDDLENQNDGNRGVHIEEIEENVDNNNQIAVNGVAEHLENELPTDDEDMEVNPELERRDNILSDKLEQSELFNPFPNERPEECNNANIEVSLAFEEEDDATPTNMLEIYTALGDMDEAQPSRKRKPDYLDSTRHNKLTIREKGEGSNTDKEAINSDNPISDQTRGAVGPIPPDQP